MNNTTLSPGTNLTALAAECFTLTRIAATAIEADVLDLGLPATRKLANAVMSNFHRRTIIDEDVLTLLKELIDAIQDEIDDGTQIITHYDHSLESVSGSATWQEQRLTPEADRLTNALVVLREFYATLAAVYDTLQAEQALASLRTAS